MSALGTDAYYSGCWLASHGHMEDGDLMPPCEGNLFRVHLIDQQRLRRMGLDPDDEATFVEGCGGWSGIAGHHGLFDGWRLRVPFANLPDATVGFAVEHSLLPWLERTYR